MYQADSKEHAELARVGLIEFETVKTELDIELPDGLEKLLWRFTISINQSAFLIEVQKKENIDRLHPPLPVSSIPKLCLELRNLLDIVASIKNITSDELRKAIQVNHGNEYIITKFFRVDVAGGDDGFTFDIQDNIGKGLYAQPRKGRPTKDPISSKFATVKLPPDIDITGEELSKEFFAALTPTSQQLLDEYAPLKKKEILPLWGICCKNKQHPLWISNAEFNTEAEAWEALLEDPEHGAHGYENIVIAKADKLKLIT